MEFLWIIYNYPLSTFYYIPIFPRLSTKTFIFLSCFNNNFVPWVFYGQDLTLFFHGNLRVNLRR